MHRIVVAATAPDRRAIQDVAAVLRAGGIAAIPTDTLYGLAADPFNPAAVERIFTIKSRELERAIPLIAASLEQAQHALGGMTPLASRLAVAFWPGPLTLVLTAPDRLPMEVTGGGTTVGIRVPAHEVARALCDAVGGPLTATSANVSGQPATSDPAVVVDELGSRLDVLVDAGTTPGGPPSTIVDVTGREPRLIRAGAISWDAVLAASTRT
jgi:L-threonylcarbamoyladenylate synthase